MSESDESTAVLLVDGLDQRADLLTFMREVELLDGLLDGRGGEVAEYDPGPHELHTFRPRTAAAARPGQQGCGATVSVTPTSCASLILEDVLTAALGAEVRAESRLK
ncbi:hypothetical protein ARTSIC4J27_1994 [Pseudarthrobacter siccitolerans]|uniref:Uncharacterized protein n=1 Tax=Pseudarthrobacter siccitolerans TaxID=861266 RepID=A0A024H2Q4_9MICC|nr:hypothetical protein [Pseudarthrobacter siccitolerans]CCQ46034.1 hypothetical protein ARTSIC4J27_1994 [Pseudarthrobacter siccitolerans]